jgi:hypothetical protein
MVFHVCTTTACVRVCAHRVSACRHAYALLFFPHNPEQVNYIHDVCLLRRRQYAFTYKVERYFDDYFCKSVSVYSFVYA